MPSVNRETARLHMAQDRIRYLMDEHQWLTDRCREYYSAAQHIESKFDDLKLEIAEMNRTIRRDQGCQVVDIDVAKFKNREPSFSDKEDLLAIIKKQQEIIDNLKEAKKKKKKAEPEEEPRNLQVDAQKKDKKLDQTNQASLNQKGNSDIGMRDFSTFGEIGDVDSKNKLQEIRRRTVKSREPKGNQLSENK